MECFHLNLEFCRNGSQRGLPFRLDKEFGWGEFFLACEVDLEVWAMLQLVKGIADAACGAVGGRAKIQA
jgi:hypothetical protein